MITCGTYGKIHLLNTPNRLDVLRNLLFDATTEYGWQLHAWAILSNHYHFIASSPSDPNMLKRMISKIHTLSASELNKQDSAPGRRVWFQYFDTHITYINSLLPRLKYVHHNPVHHNVVTDAENYRWCSAGWFSRNAKPSFRATVDKFKTDKLNVLDDFESMAPASSEKESGVKPPHSKNL